MRTVGDALIEAVKVGAFWMCYGRVAGDGEEKAGREGCVNAVEELQKDEAYRVPPAGKR